MSKPESKCTTELKHSFSEIGIKLRKISDMPHVPGAARFDIKKPFDLFGSLPIIRGVTTHAIPIVIEAKHIPGDKCFSFSSIRDHQKESLAFENSIGSIALIALFIRSGEPRVNRLHLIPWREISFRIQLGTKSISQVELEDLPYVEGRSGKYLALDALRRAEALGAPFPMGYISGLTEGRFVCRSID